MRALVWFGVAAAGAVGAPLRWLVDDWVRRRYRGRLPLGILVINVSGSLLFGLIAGFVLYHGAPANLRVIAGTGFCGAYTTFATFSVDTVTLFQEDLPALAWANIGLSLALGLPAAAAGLALAAAR